MVNQVDKEAVNTSSKGKLPYSKKLFYGVGHVLNDLCASMWFSYLLIYFHDVINFSDSMAGNLMLLGQVADALCTPFIGFESDRTVSGIRNYGKRKTWHLVGVVCVAVSFVFVFNPCLNCGGADDWAKMIYYAPFVAVCQFGWAATQISHLALIPEITRDEGTRVELNAIRYSFTVVSNICVFVLAWILLDTEGKTTSNRGKLSWADVPEFRYLSILVVAIGCVFQVIFHFGTEEPPQNFAIRHDREERSSAAGASREMTWKHWFKESQFYMIGFLYMCTRLIVNISQVYLPMYLTDTLKLEKTYIAFIPLITYLSGLFSSLLMKTINRVVGRKMTYFFFGLVPIMASCITFWFYEWVKKYHFIYPSAILLGFGCSTILVTSLSMTADLIRENTESGAFVYGCMSFLDKLANGAAVAAIQYLHPCLNCCTHCEFYYQRVMTFVPGGVAVLAALGLLLLTTQKIGVRRLDKGLRDFTSECDRDDEDTLSESSPFLNGKNNKTDYGIQ